MKNKLDSIARRAAFVVFSAANSIGLPIPEIVTKHVHYRGVVSVPIGNGRSFKMQSYGHAIENRMYWYGKRGHEPESFLPWLSAAKNASVVLDIGSNTGLYSLGAAAANSDAKVFAFEPLPRVAELVRKNAALNPGFDILVQQNAVCDSSDHVCLHDPGGDQPASASLRSDFLDCNQEVIEVQGVRIDDFVQQQKLESVDLIKVDVEGVEEIALRGMRATIDCFKPTLLIEVLDDRPELMDELQSLLDMGYLVGDLQAGGVKKYDLRSDNKKRDRNLLFTMDLETFPELA
jgi:FkbM family methyltransferase